jgi:hypothetical protein
MNAKGNYERAGDSFKSATKNYTVSSPNITKDGAKSETAIANYVNAKRNYERANDSFNAAKRNYNVSNPNITKGETKNETAKEKNNLSAEYLIKMLCPTLKSTSNKNQIFNIYEMFK